MGQDLINLDFHPSLQRTKRSGVFRLIWWMAVAMAPGSLPVSQAQQTQIESPVAIPKVFIANAGGDFGRDNPDFPVVGDGAYNKFFAGIKDWGQYEIVANPVVADWVFEISASDRQTCIKRRVPEGNDRPGSRIELVIQHDYRIELVVMNGPGNPEVRKPFIEHLRPPGLFSTAGKVFDQAIGALLDDAKSAVGQPVAGKTSLKKQEPFMAPIPPKIGSAQKVFIDNASAGDISGERYSGGGVEVSNQLTAAIKEWGRYEVVATAGRADLVFRVSFTMQPLCDNLGDPMLNLVILDAKTDFALWGIVTHVKPALLTRSAHKNFATGIATLVGSIREVAERPTWLLDASVPATAPAPAPTMITGAAAASAISAQFAALPAIPVIISAQNKVVKPGSEVRIDVTVKNASKQNLDFAYPAGDPLTCLLVVRDAGGNMVADTEEGRRLKAAHAGWQGRPVAYNLQPGEAQNRQCSVSKLFDISHPGQYAIQVKQLDGRLAQSNTAFVTVAQ